MSSHYSTSKKYGRRAVGAAKGASTIVKLANDVYRIKKQLNVEYKHTEHLFSGLTATPTTGLAGTSILNMAIGDTSETRDGNSVKPQSLHIRGTAEVNPTPEDALVRIILVQAGFGENVTPILGDILDDGTSIVNFRNIDQSRGYKVLYDKLCPLSTAGPSKRVFTMNIKRGLRHQKYDGATADEHTFGAFYLWVLSDATTNFPNVTMQSRLRYTDN